MQALGARNVESARRWLGPGEGGWEGMTEGLHKWQFGERRGFSVSLLCAFAGMYSK